MPSTHLSLHYHIIFSTKDRRPFIKDTWRDNLHAYLGGCVKTENGIPEAIGGTNDQVHLLIGLRATHQLSTVVKNVKVASSKWIHTEIGESLFAWQTGYGAFTVGVSQISKVKSYILRQEIHHHKFNFQEEYLKILKAADVDYDEKYLW